MFVGSVLGKLNLMHCVVDADPVGSDTFSRIRIRKNHSGSGSEQLRIQNEFEVKLLLKLLKQFHNFSTKMLNLTI
jgi:hypothetical protein